MTSSVPFGGVSYNLPLNREPRGWGSELANFIRAVAAKAIPTTGGSMTLTGELNLGSNYGIVVPYVKSASGNIATTGVFRFANNEGLTWRNAGNSADLPLLVNASNKLTFNGIEIPMANSTLDFFASTTSAQLASKISDETGTGSLVFGTSPTLITPTVDDGLLLNEEASVATPASGKVLLFPKSDKRLYIKDSNGVETAVGTGSGSGGINYLSSNPDAESATTGWATYKDAAGATPVDGTGGSPTTTWTRNTTSPLRGNADFKLSKPASNCQGEGVSFDFPISVVDKSRPLQINFDLNTSNANYADGDVVCYVYDVTNGTLITPNVTSVVKKTGSFSAKFDSTTSTSYRLILHVATTNATAYDLYFENFSVGPGLLVQGSGPSDWVSWAPTGSWVANTTYSGYWMKDGPNMRGRVKISLTGAPTATSLSINLPSGFTLNTSVLQELSSRAIVGQLSAIDTGVESYPGIMGYAGTNSLTCNAFAASGTYADHDAITATVPFAFASGDVIIMEFLVPIAEWAGQQVPTGIVTNQEFLSTSFSSFVADRTAVGTALPTTTPAGTVEHISLGAQPWQNSFQSSTDQVDVEAQIGGVGPFLPVDGVIIDKMRWDGTNFIGLGFYWDGSVWRISRGKYMQGTSTAWSGLPAGTRYRLRKFNPLVPAGIGYANSNEGGSVKPRKGQYSLTVTSSAAGWATTRAVAVYYQDQDGNHRLKFNITGTCTSAARTINTLTISGVTFKNVTTFYQACFGGTDVNGQACRTFASPNASTITLDHASATTAIYFASGDVELESKPTWA